MSPEMTGAITGSMTTGITAATTGSTILPRRTGAPANRLRSHRIPSGGAGPRLPGRARPGAHRPADGRALDTRTAGAGSPGTSTITPPAHSPTGSPDDTTGLTTGLVVLVPAYRPDARLPQLVSTLRGGPAGCRVLVVDDGSGPAFDEVFDLARARGADVMRHPVNAGKGRALRTGLARARLLWPQADVVCADADGQHTPSDIAAVAHRVRSTGRMALGVREFTGEVPLRSRVGNAITALLFRGATGWRLRDTQTGLRGYPAGGFEWMLGVPGDRYEYELSALLRARELGLAVEEVGIATVYEPGNTSSHFRPIQDSARIYAPLLRFTAASLTGFLIDWVGVLVLHLMTGNLLVSVVGARIISGVANFFLARRAFRARGPVTRSAARYLVLALGLVAAGYLGLRVVTGIGVPLALAKPMVDAVLYLVSFAVQQRVVFRDAGQGPASTRQR